ncbi:UNVERIFIED_CONTAM: hypothetical protein ABID98_000931 [Brevibacillus sp. OAP136]
MFLFIDFLLTLFSPYKTLVHTVFGNEAYFRLTAKLQAHGVSYRTRSHPDFRSAGNQLVPRSDFAQYDIYVKPEDEHRALAAIHGSS